MSMVVSVVKYTNNTQISVHGANWKVSPGSLCFFSLQGQQTLMGLGLSDGKLDWNDKRINKTPPCKSSQSWT